MLLTNHQRRLLIVLYPLIQKAASRVARRYHLNESDCLSMAHQVAVNLALRNPLLSQTNLSKYIWRGVTGRFGVEQANKRGNPTPDYAIAQDCHPTVAADIDLVNSTKVLKFSDAQVVKLILQDYRVCEIAKELKVTKTVIAKRIKRISKQLGLDLI